MHVGTYYAVSRMTTLPDEWEVCYWHCWILGQDSCKQLQKLPQISLSQKLTPVRSTSQFWSPRKDIFQMLLPYVTCLCYRAPSHSKPALILSLNLKDWIFILPTQTQYMMHKLLIDVLNLMCLRSLLVSRRVYTGAKTFYRIPNIFHLEELLSNYSLSISGFQKRSCLIDCLAQE